MIVYSKKAEADRAFLKDVLGLPGTDVGDGWLIFALPPSEVAVHPFDENDRHELFLLVDDVDAFVARMKRRKVRCTAINDLAWGRLTKIALPGGGKVAVYEPRHTRPAQVKKRATRSSR